MGRIANRDGKYSNPGLRYPTYQQQINESICRQEIQIKKKVFKQYVNNTKASAITIEHEKRGEGEETVQHSYEASSV